MTWHKTKLPEFHLSIQQEAWRQRLNVSLSTEFLFCVVQMDGFGHFITFWLLYNLLNVTFIEL